MSRSRVVHCCVALSLSCSATAFAQSIDPSGASLALHRPFALRLPVRTDSDNALTAQRLNACVDAEFQSGATLLFSDHMRVTLAPSPRPGWQWLVFEHPHVVDEPALLAHVVLRCPARFEREFVVQARLRDEPPTAAHTAAAVPQRPAAQIPPARPQAQTAIKAAIKARSTTALVQPIPHPAAAAPSPPLPPPLLPTPTKAVAPAVQADRAHELLAEVARLREALAAAQRQAAAPITAAPLSAAGIPSSDTHSSDTHSSDTPWSDSPDGWLRWPEAGWLLLAGSLAALLPGLRWWRLRSRLPKVQTMDIAQPPAGDAAASAPPPATRPRPPIQMIVEGHPEVPDIIPPTPIPPGAASLEDRDAARFTSQVEGLVADGYLGVAVSLLENSLQATPARNPWLMLQLLSLYERTGEASKRAQLIIELQLLYRVQLHTIGGIVQVGRPLLEVPALLAEVQQAWASPDLIDWLEDLIFRVVGPVWDLATFQDLLMLHAVATARAAFDPEPTPLAPTPFEPVLEWNVGEDP